MASTNNALLLPSQPADTNALDIRPIKGPVEIPNPLDWVWWALALVAAALIGWYLWRRYKLRKLPSKPSVVIPAHRRAMDRLSAATELMSDPYRFCSLVSDVLRGYVEERFDLRAPERTTEEFMDELRSSEKLSSEHKSLLEDFLSRCDLVKFARFEPTIPELEALLDSATRFVDETTPHGEFTPLPTAKQPTA